MEERIIVKKPFWIYLFLSVAIMISIFSFSAQNGDKSSDISMNITEKVVNEDNYTETAEKSLRKKQEEIETIVRKTAHFLIYTSLGLCVFMTLYYNGKVNKIWILFIISLIFCIFYASSDEIHQLFVSERSGEVRDVLIDSAGSCLGIVIAIIIQKIRSKKQKLHG